MSQCVISDYKKVAFNPKFAINPNQFNPSQFNTSLGCFDMDNHHQKALTWHEEKRYVKLFDFQENLIWQLNLAVCCAKFSPSNQWIWLVNRKDEYELQILLYDYQGNLLASQSIEDTYGDAGCIITLLPENNAIMLMIANGQDGSCDYQLAFHHNKINIIKKLDDNLSFLFCFDDNQYAVLLDFYNTIIYITSYPDFKILKSYQFDEMYYDNLEKISDTVWLFSDGASYRHYLFNAQTMQIQAEIVIQGYEPAVDDYGEISSKISAMSYDKGKLYFCFWNDWWAVAEFDGKWC